MAKIRSGFSSTSLQSVHIMRSLMLAAAFALLSHNPAQALSFAPGTEFLPYKSKRACIRNGGNFLRWQNEVYCTRVTQRPNPRLKVSSYKSCKKAGGRIIKDNPPLCLWKGRYFEARKIGRKTVRIRNFKDCRKYGGVLLKSYPPKCRIGDVTFAKKLAPPPKAPSKSKILWIEPYRQTCWDVEKRKCLIANGQLFYDNIRGFKFKPGYRYKLKVRVTDLCRKPNYVMPADGSSLRYDLIRVIKRQRVRWQ